MVDIGSGAKRQLENIKLSRYACYLIVQNGDSSKPVIANGQTYFAIQTRQQELADNEVFQQLKEGEKRLFLRNERREHNKKLIEAAQQAGVFPTKAVLVKLQQHVPRIRGDEGNILSCAKYGFRYNSAL